jgi:hypothetical protein
MPVPPSRPILPKGVEEIAMLTFPDFFKWPWLDNQLEYHLWLSHDLGILNDIDYENISKETVEIKQMLTAFFKQLKADH